MVASPLLINPDFSPKFHIKEATIMITRDQAEELFKKKILFCTVDMKS